MKATTFIKKIANHVRKNSSVKREVIEGKIKEFVLGNVEETINGLLEAEPENLTQASLYKRSEERQGYRSGHYSRNLTTTSEVTLNLH